MTPMTQNDLEFFRSIGMTFLPTFKAGAYGVKARTDLPKLFYPSSEPALRIEGILEKLNQNLKATYKGFGYYASCPAGETMFAGSSQFVLFADDIFYEDYKSGEIKH